MTDKARRTIRAPRGKDKPYFSMARVTAQDSRLSFEARGLLAYILSKPDDWIVQFADLKRQGIGRDKANRIFKELEQCGYLYREQDRDARGKFSTSDWRISETPFTEKPFTGEPLTVNPQLHNREYIQKRETSAPDDAAVESSKKEKTPRQRDEMVDTITTHLFKAALTDKASVKQAAIIAAWVRGTSTGTKVVNVGKNEHPSDNPQDVIAFVKWWNDNHENVHPPTSISKFPRWWRQWKSNNGGAKDDPLAGTFLL